MRQIKNLNLRGDTLIEVMLSITIFATVAMISINMMNDGINTAQRTLETEMARNEIDAQAETLRYIHNGYVSERQKSGSESEFKKIWESITTKANRPKSIDDNGYTVDGSNFDINNMPSCDSAYGTNRHLSIYNAFVLNPRLMVLYSGNVNNKYLGQSYATILNSIVVPYNGGSKISPPSLYPRIIYKSLTNSTTNTDDMNLDETSGTGVSRPIVNDVSRAEGIWIDAVGNRELNPKRSDYYDFYIRTCWHAAGMNTPSTITTVVRLYNPEVME